MNSLTRRTILTVVSAPILVVSPSRKQDVVDAKLLWLASEFDAVAAQLDHAIDHGSDISQGLLDQFSRIEAGIIATPATSLDGLRVKARAACWALLGDLDSGDQSTTDKRMALSIVRDLIRTYDPELERPGAVSELVNDLENAAPSRSSAGKREPEA